MPKEIKGNIDVLSIINRDQLPELAEIAEADVFDILHSNNNFTEDLVKDRNECLEIYRRINYLLSVAESQAKYTLFMDEDRY